MASEDARSPGGPARLPAPPGYPDAAELRRWRAEGPRATRSLVVRAAAATVVPPWPLGRQLSYGDDRLQEALVYVPPGRVARGRTAVVFAYGGSWTSGAVWPYRFVGRRLSRERPVAVVGYRHAPDARHPAQLDDLVAATLASVDRLRARGCAVDRVVLAGHSAGAHLMALAALDPGRRGLVESAGARVAGFLGISGPLDLRLVCPTPASCPSVVALMGGGSGWDAIDPRLRVAQRPPFPLLAVHGARDTVVSALATHRFAEQARAAGADVEVAYDPNGYHASVLELFLGDGPLAAPVHRWLARLDDQGD